jgi:hypothetical protein
MGKVTDFSLPLLFRVVPCQPGLLFLEERGEVSGNKTALLGLEASGVRLIQCLLSAQDQERVWIQDSGLPPSVAEGR